jgi:hypothetical protein
VEIPTAKKREGLEWQNQDKMEDLLRTAGIGKMPSRVDAD